MWGVGIYGGRTSDLGFEIEYRNKKFLIRALFAVAVPVVAAIAAIDYIKGRYLVGSCLTVIFFAQMIALYFSYTRVKSVDARREYSIYIGTLGVINVLVGFICLYTIGYSAEMSRLPWAYIYVVLVINTFDFKPSLIWAGVFLILLLLVIYLSNASFLIQESGFMARFIGTYVFLTLSIGIIKHKRGQIQQELVRNHQSLISSESRLRETNVRLTKEITGRIQIEKALRASEERLGGELAEKEVLIKEIHHRVKNNMQIISSLLRLQIRNEKNEQILNAFQEAINRISAMALVHEEIYKSESLAVIELAEYIGHLTNGILSSHKLGQRQISLKITVEKGIYVTPNIAVPSGLALNELLTNILKHAFPDEGSGEIRVSGRRVENNYLEIRVADTGVGIPQEFDWRKADTLGISLVYRLVVGQLGGHIELKREGGTEFVMTISEGANR